MATSSKSSSLIGILGMGFAILYIISEITFNLGLIDFLNSRNTEMDTFHTLEFFGRLLSSIGIGGVLTSIILFILLKIAPNIKKTVIAPIILILCAVTSYGTQTAIFNSILDRLTPEQKLNAYAFGVYRNLNLNNQVNLKILNNENKEYDFVINSMLGIFSTVSKTEKDITSTVKTFFHAENNIDQKVLGKIYDEINVAMPNLDNYWGIYVIESRKYNNYQGLEHFKKIYRQKFIEAIGIEPGLDRNAFETHVRNQMPSIQKAKSIIIVPEHKGINLTALSIGDIPEKFNKKEWITYVNNHINKALESVKFTEENINKLPHSENIISSVVITPIAIILSMLALLLNIVMFVARFTKIGAFMLAGVFITLASTWSHNPYNLNSSLNKLIGLETMLVKVMHPYTSIIHSMAINDKNPNPYQIIRIEKPQMPNMSKLKEELDSKFKSLGAVKGEDVPQTETMQRIDKIQQEIKVDKDKIDNNSYYGELKKDNPYAQ